MKIYELGHAVLYVTDLEGSLHFYQDILGFPVIGTAPGMAAFSSGRTHHELLLIEIGGKPKLKKSIEPGLYHLGFKIGNTDQELKAALEELQRAKVEIIGTADHTVTKSIYIKDPDGNEIELYVDVSEEWKKNPQLILTLPKPLR
ncbi:MAG TPA: VOC family protein [Candidatus Nanoarchaeia archaeon]|nr:VOC family protein [Candidatus Nanoarchaeia archaeon]